MLIEEWEMKALWMSRTVGMHGSLNRWIRSRCIHLPFFLVAAVSDQSSLWGDIFIPPFSVYCRHCSVWKTTAWPALHIQLNITVCLISVCMLNVVSHSHIPYHLHHLHHLLAWWGDAQNNLGSEWHKWSCINQSHWWSLGGRIIQMLTKLTDIKPDQKLQK